MNGHIATAIAAVAASITDALLEGRPTAELRRELATLEQRQRREAADAAAAERQAAATAALVAGIEERVRARVAGLEAPAAPNIRRTPQGVHFIAEVTDE